MDDDSDDDKPVLAAVMKLNAIKQEGEKNGKGIVAEKALNGKNSSELKAPATEKSKPSSSSSKLSCDSPTSVKRKRTKNTADVSDDDIPIADLMKRRMSKESTSSISHAVVKAEKIEKAVTAPKKVSTDGIGSKFYDTKKGDYLHYVRKFNTITVLK